MSCVTPTVTATWNLFVLYDEKQNAVNGDVIYVSVLQSIISKNQSKCLYNLTYNIKSDMTRVTSFSLYVYF